MNRFVLVFSGTLQNQIVCCLNKLSQPWEMCQQFFKAEGWNPSEHWHGIQCSKLTFSPGETAVFQSGILTSGESNSDLENESFLRRKGSSKSISQHET